jgi:phospholipid transport system substrate-binding protein
MIARRSALLAVLLAPFVVTVTGPAWAQPSPAAPVQAINTGLLIIMRAGRSMSFAGRLSVFRTVVDATFDLPLILRSSVGAARWAMISPEQQAELLEVFTQFTVASYVANFDAFNGESFVIAPELRHVGKDVVVQTRIVSPAGENARLDYVMRENAGQWRVVDILLDGSISRVAVTRSDFRALLAGNDASGLIKSLRDKVAGFAAGSPA